jgi:tight adherence protein C
MIAALALILAGGLLGMAALAELGWGGGGRAPRDQDERAEGIAEVRRWIGEVLFAPPIASAIARLGLRARLVRAGMAERIDLRTLMAAKLAGALTGAVWAIVVAPAAPPRLAWVVAAALPAAGFVAPDAWLERLARRRLRRLRDGLPDALDLLAVGAAAGRSPLAGLAELGAGEGPLARELAVLAAEAACGSPQRLALDDLRRRVPVQEVAALCGVIERSRRYGSPLADQLREQATALRAVQRRRVEEEAAKAAPKIQLAVALLLVPSVLLMIGAGLLANVDRFITGL